MRRADSGRVHPVLSRLVEHLAMGLDSRWVDERKRERECVCVCVCLLFSHLSSFCLDFISGGSLAFLSDAILV